MLAVVVVTVVFMVVVKGFSLARTVVHVEMAACLFIARS